MTTIEKLAQVQQSLIAPKNQFNKFGNYNYRSCEDILEGLKPCLAKVKAAVKISDEICEVSGRVYVKATAVFLDCECDAYISNTAFAREEEAVKGMSSSQVTGSASSYARKYALNGLFAIDDVKDADSRDNREVKDESKAKGTKNTEPKKETKEEPKQEAPKDESEQKNIEQMKISDIKVRSLVEKCAKDGVEVSKILKLYKVNSLSDITEKQFRNICDYWDKIVSA